MSDELLPEVHREAWDRELTPEELAEARESWPDKSEKQQRQYMKLRIRARVLSQQPADDGTGRMVFGGAQPGKRRKRLGEHIADKADDPANQKRIWDALASGLAPTEDATVRVKTAVAITKITRDEAVIQMREAELAADLDKQPLDEIKKIVAEGILQQVKSGELDLAALFGGGKSADIEGTAVSVD